ncbi:cytochrome P450 [Exophiala viscosa]|uniref:cytochrome P450 n=1 Tax=Exophiala viscosa TaxID=2486360 RepID=UPI0021A1539E|nr:cytochrome P450 [Exophiala viscosa]
MAGIFDSFTTNRLLLAFGVLSLYAAIKVVQLILHVYRCRQRWRDIPALPRHPVLGHILNIGVRLDPSLKRHPDYGFVEVWDELDRPEAFLLDMEPAAPTFLVITHPRVAESLVQPSPQYKYSIPKSDTFKFLRPLLGKESLITVEGEEWRNLRRRFNKGFSPAHLHSLDPLIISKTRIFIDKLQRLAETGETFALKEPAQDLTTDIITELTVEKDFHAQSTPEGQGHKGPLSMLTASRMLSGLCFKMGRGFSLSHYFDPVRPTRAWFYERIFNRELSTVVKQQMMAESTDDKQEHQKSITRLAISGMTPSKALVQNTVSQIKSFLFAGQDTTATLIQWLCFELSKASWADGHVAILEKLIAEHDAVFGKTDDLFNALDVLGQDDEQGRHNAEAILGNKLPYTTAFIKETLRLHPAASTARRVSEISAENPMPVTVTLRSRDGDKEIEKGVVVNGLRVYVAQYLVHRNKSVWGDDAEVFRPERFLDEEYMANLPTGAFRPFERGPRNCIGQELAMLEAKVVMCAVARGFKWEKMGYSGKKGEVGYIAKGDGTDDPECEVWSVSSVTAVPLDGMMMKVERR